MAIDRLDGAGGGQYTGGAKGATGAGKAEQIKTVGRKAVEGKSVLSTNLPAEAALPQVGSTPPLTHPANVQYGAIKGTIDKLDSFTPEDIQKVSELQGQAIIQLGADFGDMVTDSVEKEDASVTPPDSGNVGDVDGTKGTSNMSTKDRFEALMASLTDLISDTVMMARNERQNALQTKLTSIDDKIKAMVSAAMVGLASTITQAAMTVGVSVGMTKYASAKTEKLSAEFGTADINKPGGGQRPSQMQSYKDNLSIDPNNLKKGQTPITQGTLDQQRLELKGTTEMLRGANTKVDLARMVVDTLKPMVGSAFDLGKQYYQNDAERESKVQATADLALTNAKQTADMALAALAQIKDALRAWTDSEAAVRKKFLS